MAGGVGGDRAAHRAGVAARRPRRAQPGPLAHPREQRQRPARGARGWRSCRAPGEALRLNPPRTILRDARELRLTRGELSRWLPEPRRVVLARVRAAGRRRAGGGERPLPQRPPPRRDGPRDRRAPPPRSAAPPATGPAILAGDLNAPPAHPALAALAADGWEGAGAGRRDRDRPDRPPRPRDRGGAPPPGRRGAGGRASRGAGAPGGCACRTTTPSSRCSGRSDLELGHQQHDQQHGGDRRHSAGGRVARTPSRPAARPAGTPAGRGGPAT